MCGKASILIALILRQTGGRQGAGVPGRYSSVPRGSKCVASVLWLGGTGRDNPISGYEDASVNGKVIRDEDGSADRALDRLHWHGPPAGRMRAAARVRTPRGALRPTIDTADREGHTRADA